jgi:hypothetical protein
LAVNNEWNYDYITSVTPGIVSEPPTEYYLYDIYPNPFNPTTTITFTLPVQSHVKLNVYDINGRLVGAVREPPLQNQWFDAGTHNITFDGTGLASGIYFIRLTAGDFTQTQKLVLMK